MNAQEPIRINMMKMDVEFIFGCRMIIAPNILRIGREREGEKRERRCSRNAINVLMQERSSGVQYVWLSHEVVKLKWLFNVLSWIEWCCDAVGMGYVKCDTVKKSGEWCKNEANTN